jgi:hypothetical protein
VFCSVLFCSFYVWGIQHLRVQGKRIDSMRWLQQEGLFLSLSLRDRCFHGGTTISGRCSPRADDDSFIRYRGVSCVSGGRNGRATGAQQRGFERIQPNQTKPNQTKPIKKIRVCGESVYRIGWVDGWMLACVRAWVPQIDRSAKHRNLLPASFGVEGFPRKEPIPIQVQSIVVRYNNPKLQTRFLICFCFANDVFNFEEILKKFTNLYYNYFISLRCKNWIVLISSSRFVLSLSP